MRSTYHFQKPWHLLNLPPKSSSKSHDRRRNPPHNLYECGSTLRQSVRVLLLVVAAPNNEEEHGQAGVELLSPPGDGGHGDAGHPHQGRQPP